MISVERIQKKHDAIVTNSAEFVRAVEPMNDDGRDSRAVEREQQPGRDAAKASSDRQPICGTENASSRLVSLTTRDRELFVHLAIARYLSTEQISELVFSGKSDSIARRRLSRLVSGQHEYVRRFPSAPRTEVTQPSGRSSPSGSLPPTTSSARSLRYQRTIQAPTFSNTTYC